jgi:hypothetical protein
VHTTAMSRFRTSGARSFVLAGMILATSLTAFPSLASGAHAPSTQGAPWKASLRVQNLTHYQLRLVDQTKTEMTDWVKQPQAVVDPGGNLDSTVRSTPQAIGHGLFQLDTYAAYARDGGRDIYAGTFVVMDGIECKPIGSPVCLDYSRVEQSWGSVINPELIPRSSEGLDVARVHADGDPTNYYADFRLTIGPRRPTSTGNGLPADVDTPTMIGPAPNGTWGWTQSIRNTTPFTLTRQWTWNSQGTTYWGTPPSTIAPGGGVQYLYGNDVALHGPQSFVVFNATDPKRGNAYVGTVVVEAQTDCESGAKAPDVPITCLTWRVASNSFGVSANVAPEPNNLVLDAHSDTSGVQPIALQATTEVLLRPPPH